MGANVRTPVSEIMRHATTREKPTTITTNRKTGRSSQHTRLKNSTPAASNMFHIQEPRRLRRYQSAQDAFPLDERQLPEIASVQPKAIEGVEVRFLAPAKQCIELRTRTLI